MRITFGRRGSESQSSEANPMVTLGLAFFMDSPRPKLCWFPRNALLGSTESLLKGYTIGKELRLRYQCDWHKERREVTSCSVDHFIH